MKRLFQSLSRTSDGALVIDRRQHIIFWNQAAEALLGYAAEHVTGRQCHEILSGRDERGRLLCQPCCRVAIQAQRGDTLPNQDLYARTRTGARCWLNVTTFVYPVKDKATRSVIVHLFRDATEKKSYQQFADQVLSASDRLQHGNGQPDITSAPTMPPGSQLTEREWQVLRLLTQGLGTNEIAGSLTISPATVRNHVQSILEKLGVHSRPEAIAYAYQSGLIAIGEAP